MTDCGSSDKNAELVFASVEKLLRLEPSHKISIPTLARKTGLAPSVIYREWGTIEGVLAAYVKRELHSSIGIRQMLDGERDMERVAHGFASAISSPIGNLVLRLVISSRSGDAGHMVIQQLGEDVKRSISAVLRKTLEQGYVDDFFDLVLAPITCRVLGGEPMTGTRISQLVASLGDPEYRRS